MLINRFNFADDKEEAEDCDGHVMPLGLLLGKGSNRVKGCTFLMLSLLLCQCTEAGTHVAATAVGRSVGLAKGAKLVALRVLDCNGSGSISDTVAALDWVALNHRGPSVVIMSLGVSVGAWSRSTEYAVRSLVNEHGITVVVASGNKAMDACHVVPASMGEVLTVAASDMQNKFDANRKEGRETSYRWSNTGHCIDLWAPGVEIWSACGGGSRCPNVTDDSYTWASGTSMVSKTCVTAVGACVEC
ncbi:peptidase S8/S53 domain-containing protein [Dunaliella salina]|uniref:Peptidase S8/S53 domain-containing protein n=1 Tax=Dunaliella salina TaxID=3046 RepID=A0ABQ7GKA6_DUNSA|nr:peptidase S8/S53 domain-containing protein [Dunaliella salina]|eukprot:KAF5834968.1 peptidase S8/S53 domain-containing protein [Dunaliella salina]